MKRGSILLFILSVLLVSCSSSRDKNTDDQTHLADHIPPIPFTTYKSSDDLEIGKTYMPTGFYYLTGNEGVKMLKQRSDEVYNLNKFPFVSVNDILRVSLERTPLEQGISISVNLILNNEGTRALAEGTGNPVYPYLAMVIANRLLYVVKNTSKIKTGAMAIIVTGYSEADMNEMITAIRQKK